MTSKNQYYTPLKPGEPLIIRENVGMPDFFKYAKELEAKKKEMSK